MKVYVGNLPYSTSEKDLRNLFSQYGIVESVAVITDRETGRSKGFGFVEFGDDSEARNAVQALSGTEYGGRALTVNVARPKVPFTPGSRVGHYEVVGFICWPEGLYRARDTRGEKLVKNVVIRVLHLDLTAPDELSRFERESKALQALSHPNISTILDFGTQNGFAYEVWEDLEGEILSGRLHAGAIPPKQAVDYMLQVAKGLSAGHEKGIIHGDLNPNSLFVTRDGHVKILDFGQRWLKAIREKERSAAANSDFAQTHRLPSTPGYMSPEEVRGQPYDARSDIFSFGAILYEMLAGKRAFPGDGAVERLVVTMREDPPDLSLAMKGVSPGLNRLVHRCLEKDPKKRFQSMRSLASDLAAVSDALAASRTARLIRWFRI